jgi:hypothetical protein
MRCSARRVHVLQGEVMRIDETARDDLALIGLTQDSDWTRFSNGTRVSGSLATKCYRCELRDGRTIYFKRYVYPMKYWLEFWLRPGKAAVECWAFSRLRELGIPTLETIAFGERRLAGMLLGVCIATRGVPDAIDLQRFVRTVWCQLPRSERIAIARAIGRRLLAQVRTAHQAHFFHHDLKFRNLLINPSGDPDSLVWIDAPRASRMWLRHRRGVITDLSGLARTATSLFSRFELMRFLHFYLGPGAPRGEAKRLFREVQRHLGRRPPKALELAYPD